MTAAESVLVRLAPPGLALSPALERELAAAYASPPRAYHSLAHVEEVARRYDEVTRDVGWQHPHEVYVAVLFHDAVYVPGASDNEARSAALAADAIARHRMGLDARRVRELIELTSRHGTLALADVDRDAALFLDCDTAILGAAPDVFAAYDRAIAVEYAHVPRAAYDAGRRAFLERLLTTPRIFLSDYFAARLGAQAVSNLRAALGRIQE